MSVVIRPMRRQDLAACAALEQTAQDPWSAAQLAEELAGQQTGGAARLFVAAQTGRVLGLAVFQLAADEASLYTLTVAPVARRQGVARQLLGYALNALHAEGAAVCFLEVRASNLPALALYESLGFARAGMRRAFYQNPPEDAIVMNRTLE